MAGPALTDLAVIDALQKQWKAKEKKKKALPLKDTVEKLGASIYDLIANKDYTLEEAVDDMIKAGVTGSKERITKEARRVFNKIKQEKSGS